MEDAYPGFATVMLPLLRPARYIKDEILASSTMSTRELTFVVSGACESVDVLSTRVLERYPPGACFGEETLFHPLEEVLELAVFVRASEVTETLTLVSEDWRYLKRLYPKAMRSLKELLLARLDRPGRHTWLAVEARRKVSVDLRGTQGRLAFL